MTKETQALVDRLRKRAREEPSNGQGGGKMLMDAAAALTSLARELETARQELQNLPSFGAKAAREGRE